MLGLIIISLVHGHYRYRYLDFTNEVNKPKYINNYPCSVVFFGPFHWPHVETRLGPAAVLLKISGCLDSGCSRNEGYSAQDTFYQLRILCGKSETCLLRRDLDTRSRRGLACAHSEPPWPRGIG